VFLSDACRFLWSIWFDGMLWLLLPCALSSCFPRIMGRYFLLDFIFIVIIGFIIFVSDDQVHRIEVVFLLKLPAKELIHMLFIGDSTKLTERVLLLWLLRVWFVWNLGGFWRRRTVVGAWNNLLISCTDFSGYLLWRLSGYYYTIGVCRRSTRFKI